MRADDRQIRHPDLPVPDHSHPRDAIPISGIEFPEISAETAIDLLDDHIDPRQLQPEQIDAPALERLGHNGMIGVGHGLDDGIPRVLPRVGVHVHQDPHQFRHAAARAAERVDIDSEPDFHFRMPNSPDSIA